MKYALKQINQIPVPTWRWLHVNHVDMELDYEQKQYTTNAVQQSVDGISIQPIDQAPLHIREKLRADRIDESVKELIASERNQGYFITIPKGFQADEPVIIEYQLDNQEPTLMDETIVLAEEGSKATIVMQYQSKDDQETTHCGVTHIVAQENADIAVIKTQTLSGQSKHVDYVSGVAEEDAKVSLVLVELGSKQVVGNANIELLGQRSQATIDSLFVGYADQLLDFNYRVAHHGKGTLSDIEGRGVLLDQCKKVFRGTLDFLQGASQSVGNETEFVVLLSERVQNLSVPLMLCAEDDVQGAHAASAGKIDENKMFYLESRGLNEVEAKKLILEAEFTPILAKIPSAALRDQLTQQVRRSLQHVK